MFTRGLIVMLIVFSLFFTISVAPLLFLGYHGMEEFDSFEEIEMNFPNYSIVVVENTLFTKNVLVLKNKGEKDVFVKTSDKLYDSLLAEAK